MTLDDKRLVQTLQRVIVAAQHIIDDVESGSTANDNINALGTNVASALVEAGAYQQRYFTTHRK